ncbi:MAG: hypothetical protein EA380_00470, partial [Phycisphaeraceae bacterium]
MLLTSSLVLGACSSGATNRSTSLHDLARPTPVVETDVQRTPPTPPAPFDPRALPAFDGATGQPVGWDALVARAAAAPSVLIGEIHGHQPGLDAAAALWEDILSHSSGSPSPALALEFFERDHQTHLDDYLTGITDEATFLDQTGRSLNSGSYPPGHRAMVEAAKAASVPVIAANAPRRYVRLSRLEGLDRLEAMTPEQRRLVAIPDELTPGPYRERFFSIMGGMHQSDGEPDEDSAHARNRVIETFFTAQNVWDETMADSVAEAIRSGRMPVVLVVGQFHTDFEGGLTTRLRDR